MNHNHKLSKEPSSRLTITKASQLHKVVYQKGFLCWYQYLVRKLRIERERTNTSTNIATTLTFSCSTESLDNSSSMGRRWTTRVGYIEPSHHYWDCFWFTRLILWDPQTSGSDDNTLPLEDHCLSAEAWRNTDFSWQDVNYSIFKSRLISFSDRYSWELKIIRETLACGAM